MIPSENTPFVTAAFTDPGRSGKNNEDRFAVTSFTLSKTDPVPVLFAMVADGIGGKQAGELAAEIAVETIVSSVEKSDGLDPIGTMRNAIIESNDVILEKSRAAPENEGMGTTATCAWIIGNQLFAANVGNSRLYLLRNKELKRISIDHSWVEEALKIGLLTAEQAKNHPNARIITRHLGSQEIEPDFRLQMSSQEDDSLMVKNQGMQLLPEDLLLICSDGLSDVVEDEEIEAALQEHTLHKALTSLTDLANARGGPDNITSVAILIPQVGSTFTAPTVPIQRSDIPVANKQNTRSTATSLTIYIVSILILVALIILGWMFLPVLLP